MIKPNKKLDKNSKRILGLLLVFIWMEVFARCFFSFNWHGFEKSRKFLSGEIPPNSVSQMCIPQAYLLYIPTPLYRNEFGIQHNQQGFRGPMVPLERTPGVLRILCLGGSTTYGWGADYPEESYPAHLGTLLNRDLPPGLKGVEVINAGLPSGTSAEMLTHYEFKFHYFHPDLVIINTGDNDPGALGTKYYHPDYSHFRRQIQLPEPLPPVGRALLKSRLFALFLIPIIRGPVPNGLFYSYEGIPPYARWYSKGTRPDGTTDLNQIPEEDIGFKHNLDLVLDQLEKDKVKVLIVPFRMNPSAFDEFAKERRYSEDMLKRIAQVRKLPFAPFPAEVISKGNWVDLCHTNGTGYGEKAKYLLPYVKKILWNRG